MMGARNRSPGHHVKELERRLEYIRDRRGGPSFAAEVAALEWALPILQRARSYAVDAHLLRQHRAAVHEEHAAVRGGER